VHADVKMSTGIDLADAVRSVMSVAPQAPAMEYAGRWWKWADLSEVMAALAVRLEEAGLGRGARLGCLMRNRPEVAATILGAFSSGRCIVTLNAHYPETRLAAEIEDLRLPVVIGTAEDWARPELAAATGKMGCLALELPNRPGEPVRALGRGSRAADACAYAAGVAIEMLTSGTTGPPKRIALQALALERAIDSAARYDSRSTDSAARLRSGVQILNAPFAHISGVFALLNCITAGRMSCLLDRFSVRAWVDAVRRHRPKVAGAPPAALRMILDANVPKEDLQSLVAFRTGTAPLDPDLANAFLARYGIPVLQNYGATEFAGGVAGWTLDDFQAHGKDKRGAVGRLNAGIEARIVDPETAAPQPGLTRGLLQLRAPHLGDGVQWVSTNDIGTLDSDRFLWIHDRHDSAIIRGGFKVFPEDIVRALEQHSAVMEAAAVGLPDPRLGRVPAAAYRLREGFPEPAADELESFLRARLLPYQLPTRLIRLEDFPRTPSMKVSLPQLAAILSGQSS